MTTIVDERILAYAEQYSSPESEVLRRINRDTHAKVLRPRMLSGHLQGRILSMISHMVSPKHVLEIGTYTGYSAVCLAEGLRPEGRLITIDINEELERSVRKNFDDAGVSSMIDYRIGNALEIIPALHEKFDLVFIDADKENYCNYYDLVIDKVNLNGVILADNVLWSGKVIDGKTDKDTLAIQTFNEKVASDNRVEQVILPVRDGIMMIRKVE